MSLAKILVVFISLFCFQSVFSSINLSVLFNEKECCAFKKLLDVDSFLEEIERLDEKKTGNMSELGTILLAAGCTCVAGALFVFCFLGYFFRNRIRDCIRCRRRPRRNNAQINADYGVVYDYETFSPQNLYLRLSGHPNYQDQSDEEFGYGS